MELSVMDISNDTFNYLINNEDNDDIVKTLISNFISYSSKENPNFWEYNLESKNRINFVASAIKSIKLILNTKLEYLSSINQMKEFKLIDLIMLMQKDHYHQNMNTSNLPTAFPTKNKSMFASCGFHKESLFEHSVLAMWYSMFTPLKI